MITRLVRTEEPALSDKVSVVTSQIPISTSIQLYSKYIYTGREILNNKTEDKIHKNRKEKQTDKHTYL